MSFCISIMQRGGELKYMKIMNRIQRFTNSQLKLAAFVLVALAIVVPTLTVSAAGSDPQNNVLYNGCSTLSACKSAMSNGDGNGHNGEDITKIYNYFGITSSNITSMVPVTVYKNGNVNLNQAYGTFKSGATIATNAQSVGRQDIDGSSSHLISSIGVYERSTSVSFISNSIGGWALMSGGEFKAFILSECGNAGTGTPVTPPAAPKPAPVPTTPCGCTLPPTPVQPQPPVTPQGFVTCQELDATNEGNNEYDFNIVPTTPTGNAVIEGYQFTTFVNGEQQAQLPEQTSTQLTETVAPGTTLTVEGQVVSTVGTSNNTNDCMATESVPAQLTSVVTTPSSTPAPAPTSLPSTGPESALGGAAGLTGIGVAGRAYLRSRKSLLASLRSKR